MMSTLLAGSRDAIEHAKDHISDLKLRLDAFFGEKPYADVVDLDADGIHKLYKVRITKPVPRRIRGTAYDAAQSLRNSLDQAGYAVSRAAGMRARQTHFPFGDTEALMRSRMSNDSREIPKEILTIMASFKPYRGGDDVLWSLNELCNANKHRTVYPMIVTTGSMFGDMHFKGGPLAWPTNSWDRSKNELTIARVPIGSEYGHDLELSAFVTFGDIETLAGKPIQAVLGYLARKVPQIIDAIELGALNMGLKA